MEGKLADTARPAAPPANDDVGKKNNKKVWDLRERITDNPSTIACELCKRTLVYNSSTPNISSFKTRKQQPSISRFTRLLVSTSRLTDLI